MAIKKKKTNIDFNMWIWVSKNSAYNMHYHHGDWTLLCVFVN